MSSLVVQSCLLRDGRDEGDALVVLVDESDWYLERQMTGMELKRMTVRDMLRKLYSACPAWEWNAPSLVIMVIEILASVETAWKKCCSRVKQCTDDK